MSVSLIERIAAVSGQAEELHVRAIRQENTLLHQLIADAAVIGKQVRAGLVHRVGGDPERSIFDLAIATADLRAVAYGLNHQNGF